MNQPVLARREGAVQVLSFNNPAACNALTAEVYQALPARLEQAQRDPEVGAVVLTGVGGAFCAGGDLNRLAQRRAMTQSLAAGPERAIGRIKHLCRQAGENTLEAQLNLEADYMTESLGDDESAEGIAAFFGKRPADFAALRRVSAVDSH